MYFYGFLAASLILECPLLADNGHNPLPQKCDVIPIFAPLGSEQFSVLSHKLITFNQTYLEKKNNTRESFLISEMTSSTGIF